MKAARDLLKAGRVTEARYEPPLLAGYVREGAKNYRSGLRITNAIDVENLCSCWEARSAGKICAHSVAVGLAYLNPPPVVVAAAPFATTETENDRRFVPVGMPDANAATLHIILPPNFSAAWQRGQVMLVVEAEVSGRRAPISTLPKNATFACDDADLSLVDGLRGLPEIFASGIATLSRDGFLRLLPSLQKHPPRHLRQGDTRHHLVNRVASGATHRVRPRRRHLSEGEPASERAPPLECDRRMDTAKQRVLPVRRSFARRLNPSHRAAALTRPEPRAPLSRLRSSAAAGGLRGSRRRGRSPAGDRHRDASIRAAVGGHAEQPDGPASLHLRQSRADQSAGKRRGSVCLS